MRSARSRALLVCVGLLSCVVSGATSLPVALLAGRVQASSYPMNWGTLGESLLKGRGTQWYYSQAGVVPTEDWMWNDRRGYSISAILSYKTGGRIRFRANSAAGATTSRDWATDGTLTDRNHSTPNSKFAVKKNVFRWHPSVILFSLGTNDANYFRGAELSFADHKLYFGQVLDAVQAEGITPIVLLSPPRDDKFGLSPRKVDTYLVGEQIERQRVWDRAECRRRGISYINLTDLFGTAAHPPEWLPEYRSDGIHYHLPKAAKRLAEELLAFPGVARWFSPAVPVARHAPANGRETQNLIRFACFQGPDSLGKTRNWSFSGEQTAENCPITFETPSGDTSLLGRVLTITRTQGSRTSRGIYQDVSDIAPNDELRFSGKFRASGFGDLFWDELTGDPPAPQARCHYTIGLKFRDALGFDLGEPYYARPCESWSIDTDGKWWTFNMDLVVPPNAVSARVEFISAGTAGLVDQNAKLEVANVSLRYLGPGGNGIVYP